MAEEAVESKSEQPEVTVEVAEDTARRPELTDEEVSKLAEPPPEDEIGRYAHAAQKRIKALLTANQEWKRRVTQSNKDIATATNLAQQLYQENQELKSNVGRSETALIEQALERTEAQLKEARMRARQAYAAQNLDQIMAANEEVARAVVEADRLKLLRAPQASKENGSTPSASPAPTPTVAVPQEDSEGTKAWKKKNPWFGTPGEEERTLFAYGVDRALERQGITETTNAALYWSTIDKRLREAFPQRFEASGQRPVAVTGATRTNGAAESHKRSPRHIVLTESQVRIATTLGLTPVQYAEQLIKDEAKAKEGVS